MNLDKINKRIRETFIKRKSFDFEEYDIHFELETMTAREEIKVIESCKGYDGAEYIDALKRHTLACAIKKLDDSELDESIDYEEKGEKKSMSKYLYFAEKLGTWPSTLISVLFDAYTDMNNEVEDKINKGSKFEMAKISEPIAPETESTSGLRKIEEPEEDDSDLTEVEKLNAIVKDEAEAVESHMSEVGEEAQENIDQ